MVVANLGFLPSVWNVDVTTASQAWTRPQKAALALSGVLLFIFFVCIIAGFFLTPLQSERALSFGLICISGAISAFAFTFLSGQTARIQLRWLGNSANVGGVVAAFLISYVTLQFFVRGTTSLYIELFSDDNFKQQWRTPSGQNNPEFLASLREYSVVAYPEGSNLRLFNLPIFGTISISVRDSRWRISKLASENHT
jgi:hypothetical protein